MHRSIRRDDRGVSSLELLGVVTLVALLVAGVTLGVARYPDHLASVLCRFVVAAGGGAGSCDVGPVPVADAPTDADFQPGVCMLNSTSEQYNAEVKVWFLSIGDSSGFIVQEFSDGSVRATLTDGASVGASTAVSSNTFDTDKLGDGNAAGLDVNLGGNLTFGYGDTWEFDDAAQWTAMKDQLDDYLIQRVQLQNDQYGGVALWLWMSDGYVSAPKDPMVSYATIGVDVALDASGGVRVPTGHDSTGKETFLDPQAGLNLEVSAGGSVVVETNHETGERSYTYELTGSGEAGADAVVAHASGEGEIQGAFTTTYDANGELSELSFKSSYEVGYQASLGNGSLPVSGSYGEGETTSVVTTTTIGIDDSNRALADEWLSFRNGASQTLSLPFGAMVPDRPSSDPFLQLLYEQGRTSQIAYHGVSDGWEFGLAVKKGWEFGFSISAEEATATKTDAAFLGAPGVDGSRAFIDDALCN
ncbi:hypothetical protein [Actinotalea sp. K2]|uniref:hypothetical protein n=1 Tax=Actinotalea sp. K2 TaxID=2939438 RepID=UPI00201819FE|nr:hypothetical protein [Actinotalea sp. K2]MCL3859930.1 hypothetical protein [Actinotalea sp. K2]